MQLSDFLYLGSCYVRVVLLNLLFGLLDEVSVAFMFLWQSMGVAVRAVTGLAPEAEETNLFGADEAPRVVLLLGLRCFRNLRYFELLYLFLDALFFLMLPWLLKNYLKQTEHMLSF